MGVQLISSMVFAMVLQNQTRLIFYKEIPKGVLCSPQYLFFNVHLLSFGMSCKTLRYILA
jgi:hypothetical protein